jgi:hypothetical protein
MGVPEATEYLHELLKQRGVPHQFRAGNIHYSLEHEADVTAAAEDARSRYWPDYSEKPSYAEYNATILQMCDDLQLDCYEFTFAGEHRLAIRVPSDRQSVTLHDQIMAVILKRPLNMELVEPE